MISDALQMILQNSQQYILSLNPANMYTLTNKIIGMIIPQMINRGCNKDHSNQQNHKGRKLGFFANTQSIDLLIAPNGLPDIQIGTEIAIKLLNKLQTKARICK
ncbi:hypothetical protein TTHERM_00901660 (macronuclear) [Tetrahymena thermophila SB210]|uniref:Uncharacterized protein n=1 Tax=Tetrahymena thermophila (strain SB210) TaxID=312017 RepID=Q24GD3_TETTS|nr:hypothetical protein TTHERM_00901660 [Tetrahymena thermophila SB210]EAS06797.2 hypothetical protein TTHERM_00901660 [Tetrahymena thermophila SB210]|eukprot:XP_001027039.2 hypothetical protein TTHERM_00901660 [Tetrahymena thermophila SB210]